MKQFGKGCSAALALCIAALPTAASATCVSRDDLHAMQASALQQRLMVSAFQCHYVDQYNRFVLSHQPELQKFDAALLAFFKRGDPNGTAAYNTYKTHLANISALEQSHSYTFCDDITAMYQRTTGTGSLEPLLDMLPLTDTAYATCEVPESNAPIVASNPETETQAPPVVAPPVVVASVPPPPPVTRPVSVTAQLQDPPAKQLTPPGRALKWVGGLLKNVTSLVGIGDSAQNASPPASSDPTPSSTSSAPASNNADEAAAGGSIASRTATTTWEPNQPLITADGDHVTPVSSRDLSHNSRTEDDPLYGEGDDPSGDSTYDDAR